MYCWLIIHIKYHISFVFGSPNLTYTTRRFYIRGDFQKVTPLTVNFCCALCKQNAAVPGGIYRYLYHCYWNVNFFNPLNFCCSDSFNSLMNSKMSSHSWQRLLFLWWLIFPPVCGWVNTQTWLRLQLIFTVTTRVNKTVL